MLLTIAFLIPVSFSTLSVTTATGAFEGITAAGFSTFFDTTGASDGTEKGKRNVIFLYSI